MVGINVCKCCSDQLGSTNFGEEVHFPSLKFVGYFIQNKVKVRFHVAMPKRKT